MERYFQILVMTTTKQNYIHKELKLGKCFLSFSLHKMTLKYHHKVTKFVSFLRNYNSHEVTHMFRSST